jgi:ribonuclease I
VGEACTMHEISHVFVSRVITSRRMEWMRHVACIRSHSVFVPRVITSRRMEWVRDVACMRSHSVFVPRVITSRRMEWMRHGSCIRYIRNAYRMLDLRFSQQ